jgi:hypothetical protein
VIGFILGIHLFLNNNEVALDATGQATVAAGTYAFSIRNSVGDVLKAGDITVAPCTQGEPTPTVVSETPIPVLTPPSTDTGIDSGSHGTNGLPLVLVALAGVIATTLILSPRRKPNR